MTFDIHKDNLIVGPPSMKQIVGTLRNLIIGTDGNLIVGIHEKSLILGTRNKNLIAGTHKTSLIWYS